MPHIFKVLYIFSAQQKEKKEGERVFLGYDHATTAATA